MFIAVLCVPFVSDRAAVNRERAPQMIKTINEPTSRKGLVWVVRPARIRTGRTELHTAHLFTQRILKLL
jgi:hypothetical protein